MEFNWKDHLEYIVLLEEGERRKTRRDLQFEFKIKNGETFIINTQALYVPGIKPNIKVIDGVFKNNPKKRVSFDNHSYQMTDKCLNDWLIKDSPYRLETLFYSQ